MAKYRAIRQALLDRILAGDWPPGAAIPHEAALAAEFGVTRPTISRALAALVAGGLVERRRRAGSRVAARPAPDAVLPIPVLREAVEAAGARYAHRLIARAVAPPPAEVRARFGGRGPALRLRTLHLADGRPHQLEERWIDLRALPEAAAQDFAATSANEWLVRQVPYSRAEHVIAAEAAAPDEAAALGIAAGSPVLVIERTTWAGAAALTHARLVHPPGARLVARSGLRPADAAAEPSR